MTLRTATRDQGAGITAPRSRAWAIGSGADASGALPGETDDGTPMTNIIWFSTTTRQRVSAVLCARLVPTIEHYDGGQNTPSPEDIDFNLCSLAGMTEPG
jgi:hypothetical protein